MKIIWSLKATRDRNSAILWLNQFDPDAALDLLQEILLAIKRLDTFPFSGRIGKVSGTREVIIGKYILVYQVQDDNLEVVRLLHSSMKYP